MTGFFDAIFHSTHENTPQCIEAGQLVYREDLRRECENLAATLPAKQRIAIHCQSTHLFTVALIATWLRSSDAILPATAKTAYLDDISDQFDLFLDDQEIRKRLDRTDVKSSHKAVEPQAPNDCHIIFFTSGSTGAPKPVAKTLAQIEAEVSVQDALWSPRIPKDARVIGLVSHQHIYGLIFRVVWPVMSGRVYTADPAPFWEMIQGDLKNGDVLITSPAHLKNLHPGLAQAARPSLIFSSGGPLDHEAAQATKNMLGTCPIEVYGSTETGGIAYRQQTVQQADWRPLPGVKVRLNTESCIDVRGFHIAGDDWYHTEDRATIHPETGNFRLLGRADRVVKVEGKRVSLSAVERHLIASDLIEDATVLLPEQNDGRLGAIVVLSSDGLAKHQEIGPFRLGRYLRRKISKFEDDAALPQRWRFVDCIPSDSQGKRPLHLLRAVFNKKPTEPDILEKIKTDDHVQFKMKLPGDLIYFTGHFPGAPILPGVAQIHWAVSYASSIFGTPPTTLEISQLKFRKPILPDNVVTLDLQFDRSTGRVKFRYCSSTDGDMSSGILKYDGALA